MTRDFGQQKAGFESRFLLVHWWWTPIAAWQPVRAIDSLDFSNAS
jgi:hypothetical protein